MSIGKTGGLNNFQHLVDQANFAKTRTVNAEQGRVAAQNSGLASEKSKDSEPAGERFTISSKLQAQLAQEQKTLSDDVEVARQGMADEANQAHGDTKAKEKDTKERKLGESRVEQKSGHRVYQLDDGSEETYEVPKPLADKLDALDRRTPDQILQGMPQQARAASEATLTSQIQSKGMEKVSQMKEDPKVSDKVEQMKLGLADKEWKENLLEPIRTAKHEPALQMDDPHAEATAKEHALQAMQQGGEQMMV